jgi:hypothetical protein
MSLYDRIDALREHHSQISAKLKEVEHAPDTLRSHLAYISDLQKHFAHTSERLEKVAGLTHVSREEHERFRDSTVRRLMYRATGKRDEFEAKADSEMKRYYRALEKENELKTRKTMLDAQIREATDVRKELEVASTERSRLLGELGAMYERLFEGPTAEFPEEDAQEETTKAARACYGELRGRLHNIQQAVQCLATAQLTIRGAVLDGHEALRRSGVDMWGFGSSLTDIGTQNCLSRAQAKASQTQMLVLQAMKLDPNVQPLPSMDIMQGNMISGIIFNNMLFNISFLTVIQQSLNQVENAESVLRTQLQQAKAREADLRIQAENAASDLDSAQEELHRIREQVFMKTVDPPPPYIEQQNSESIQP